MSELNLLPAFEDTVEQSQAYFRFLLKAMSEPGTIIDTDKFNIDTSKLDLSKATNTSQQVFSSTWEIMQAVLDSDCTIYLSPILAEPTLIQSIQFYTDATITDTTKNADFAFLTLAELTTTDEFNSGTLEAPHHSCTMVIQVNNITHNPQLILSGPGIKTSKSIEIENLSPEQTRQIENNHRNYPCGLDFIFTTPKQIMALPRSTLILPQAQEK